MIANARKSILYVDDEEFARLAFARSLPEADYAITIAESAERATALLASKAFDAVVTDFLMPGIDGIELCRKIRASHPDMVIVLVSGMPEVEMDASLDVVDAVFTKPWSNRELVAALEHLMGPSKGRRQRDDRFTEVLLVEDDRDHAELLRRYIESSSEMRLRVVHAWNTKDAVALLQSRGMELVICDLGLPDARGLDVVRRLQHEAPSAAILVVSGNDDFALAKESIALGAQDFLIKDYVRPLTLERALLFAYERKRAEKRLSYLAEHDELTNLVTRKRMIDRLSETISRCTRTGDLFGVLYFDLDGFKDINDRMGHKAGDDVLRAVAQRARSSVRDYDVCGRFGGDEFVVLLEAPCGEHAALEVAERLVASIREPFVISGQEARIGASVGVAMFPAAGTTAETLLAVADEAMYRAKAGGGSAVDLTSANSGSDGRSTSRAMRSEP